MWVGQYETTSTVEGKKCGESAYNTTLLHVSVCVCFRLSAAAECATTNRDKSCRDKYRLKDKEEVKVGDRKRMRRKEVARR